METKRKIERRRGALKLLVGLAAGAVATGGVLTQAAAQAPVRAAAIFSVPNPSAVNGWDRGQSEGVQQLRNQGWNVTVAEAVPFPRLAETASGYAQSGFDVVIFTSSGHIGAWNEVAPKFPKTLFVLMSGTNKLPDAPNVRAYAADFYGYGVLAGVTAATASKSKRIAAVGGVAVPAQIAMFSGVIEGAKAVRPETEVFWAFSGDWVNVPRAREVAALQIQKGADVIVANAGPGTRGILDAAEAGKAVTIGYATDWYPDSNAGVLTSLLMNIPGWYAALAKDYAAKNLKPQIVTFGLESFALTDFRGKLSAADEKAVRDAFNRVQSRQLVVPVKMHDIK
jgi:basic membrane lipoprotein Med (substrate-binding protein (PBP1-ABC) superfamily)